MPGVISAYRLFIVALFARAWIEMAYISGNTANPSVALFARAWIEIPCMALPS